MSSRCAVYAARFHNYVADTELSEGDDTALSALMLLAIDIATHGRAAMQERAQELLRLMDPMQG